MVYLKSLHSTLYRLAKRQSSQLFMEAQQEHVKILFFKMSYSFIQNISDCKILSLFNNTTSA